LASTQKADIDLPMSDDRKSMGGDTAVAQGRHIGDLGMQGATDHLTFTASPVAVKDLQRLGEGRQAELFTWPPGGVVKLFRRAEALEAARSEADAMRLLSSSRIPMARFLGTVTVEVRPGIVMEHLVGADQLTLLGRKPWRIWSVATALGRLHASLHSVAPPKGLPPLRAFIREEIELSEWVSPELKALALADLDRLPDGEAVCHWDFHPGNVIETADGPRIIDWANVRRGDGLADVARTRLIIRSGALPPGAPILVRWFNTLGRGVLVWRYLSEYRRRRPFAKTELEAWTRVSLTSRLSYGLPQEREHLLALIAEC